MPQIRIESNRLMLSSSTADNLCTKSILGSIEIYSNMLIGSLRGTGFLCAMLS